jgi:hypothetical protein
MEMCRQQAVHLLHLHGHATNAAEQETRVAPRSKGNPAERSAFTDSILHREKRGASKRQGRFQITCRPAALATKTQ